MSSDVVQVIVEVIKHLPTKHDQSSHGRGGVKSSEFYISSDKDARKLSNDAVKLVRNVAKRRGSAYANRIASEVERDVRQWEMDVSKGEYGTGGKFDSAQASDDLNASLEDFFENLRLKE